LWILREIISILNIVSHEALNRVLVIKGSGRGEEGRGPRFLRSNPMGLSLSDSFSQNKAPEPTWDGEGQMSEQVLFWTSTEIPQWAFRKDREFALSFFFF
jgi:hypothetical protein